MRTLPAIALLRSLFDAAVAAVNPELCVPRHLPMRPDGRILAVGAGKASAMMAHAVEGAWDGPLCGLVVTRYGHAVACRSIEVVEAGHPHPDGVGLEAAERMLRLVSALGQDDVVLALISGGGSALLPCPVEGLTLADEQAVGRLLLASGAAIGEINCVRKHISRIKGGRLARAAFPAKVVTLIISDVPGDVASDVASGPTLADPTTAADALHILERYRIDVRARIVEHLRRGHDETPKPGDPGLARSEWRIIARARDALEAAAQCARKHGIEPVILGDDIQGEARDVARAHAQIAIRCAQGNGPAKLPCVLLSGGETTVTVRGNGRGGRNAEYALALALALQDYPGISALAADTDGIDGTEDNAGAIVTSDSLQRATALGIDAGEHLADNDAYSFFASLGDLVITGPTFTNVNDFRAILIEASA